MPPSREALAFEEAAGTSGSLFFWLLPGGAFLMRALLIPVFVLVLAGCGKGDQAANNQNVADSLTADSIVSNDVTAIDAVTGDAANMAADVDMNFGNLEPKGHDSGTSKDESSKPD